ncbi:hypothetical protein [Kordiimonas sp.]|uniref:hypothetical protein n=1 Tax=Kordiimonas sp. TaxID=1970157 RepID=UPI003A94AD93
MGSSISLVLAGAAMLGFTTVGSASNVVSDTQHVAKSEAQGQSCSKGNTGVAGISVSGKEGDAFTISLTCGSTVVTSCTATVNSSGIGQCHAQATMPNSEAMTCPVKAASGNSKQAGVIATSCY